MNAQQIDDILSQAKIDKNGRIMNKGRLNDMLHSLHLREVENLNKADVGGSLPSIHVECEREGTMQEHNYLTSMERKGYQFITCETRMQNGGRYTYYYFRKQ